MSVLLADYISSKIYDRGLLPFNPEKAIRWAVEQADVMRTNANENMMDSYAILATYLNEAASTAITAMYNSPSAKPIIPADRLPRGEVHVRYNLFRQQASNSPSFNTGYVQIDQKHLRDWLLDKNHDWNLFRSGLDKGLMKQKSGKAYLAKDSGIRLPQSNVIAVDLTHPEMQGVLTDADTPTAPQLATVTNLQR